MRIIAGRLRRRKLLTNPGLTTRPIIDRAKVILFDRIRDRLPGARVADLFCGTGTLGLEALSRGARSAVFAEQDHRAHELLVQNVHALGVAEQSLCWRVSVTRCSFKPKGDGGWFPYDVVFFDPPYPLAAEMAPGGDLARCLQRLGRADITSPHALLVVRSPRHSECRLPAPWEVRETLEVGSMQISLAEKTSTPPASDLEGVDGPPELDDAPPGE